MADLDLLELAEDVALGRRTLDNVIDQIAVSIPDGRARRRAVSEVESLILGLTGVRAHARAMATQPAGEAGLVVEPRAVRARGGRFGRAGAFAFGLAALSGIVIVAVVAASLRAGLTIGDPSPSLPAGAAGAPTPTAAPTGAASPDRPAATLPPIATPGPSASPAPTWPAGSLVLWTRVERALTVLAWTPTEGGATRTLFTVDTLPMPLGTAYEPTVLVAPDGARIAIAEHGFGDPASHDRTRVFDLSGHVLWTSPDDLPRTVDMAWSADARRLVLGAVPAPWTVLTFQADDSVVTRAYPLADGGAYRLIAFSPDGASIAGYESSGDAEFWMKPVEFDPATGSIAALTAFPPRLVPSTTSRWITQIDPESGDVLALDRDGQQWTVRHGDAVTAVPGDPAVAPAWGPEHTILRLDRQPASGGAGTWVLHRDPVGGAGQHAATTEGLVPGDREARLAAGPNGPAIVLGYAPGRIPAIVDPGADDVLLVDVAGNGSTMPTADPATSAAPPLWVAGWSDRALTGVPGSGLTNPDRPL